MKVHLVCSQLPQDQSYCLACNKVIEQVSPEEAEIIVCYGGDGLMLETISKFHKLGKKFYGLARTDSVGFLMNKLTHSSQLLTKLQEAVVTEVPVLEAEVEDPQGETVQLVAVNEFLLTNRNNLMVELEIKLNQKTHLAKLRGDGLLIATPLGSTAHNYSAGGAILPLDAGLLCLQPIAPFIPRCWRGALISDQTIITIKVLNEGYRPGFISADGASYIQASKVKIALNKGLPLQLLFAEKSTLNERIAQLQFPNKKVNLGDNSWHFA